MAEKVNLDFCMWLQRGPEEWLRPSDKEELVAQAKADAEVESKVPAEFRRPFLQDTSDSMAERKAEGLRRAKRMAIKAHNKQG